MTTVVFLSAMVSLLPEEEYLSEEISVLLLDVFLPSADKTLLAAEISIV